MRATKRYYVLFLVVTLAIYWSVAMVYIQNQNEDVHYFWLTNLVIFGGTVLSRKLIDSGMSFKGQSFVAVAVANTVLRLLFYFGFVMVLIFISDEPMKNDVIHFGISYLLVTVFDVIFNALNSPPTPPKY